MSLNFNMEMQVFQYLSTDMKIFSPVLKNNSTNSDFTNT